MSVVEGLGRRLLGGRVHTGRRDRGVLAAPVPLTQAGRHGLLSGGVCVHVAGIVHAAGEQHVLLAGPLPPAVCGVIAVRVAVAVPL